MRIDINPVTSKDNNEFVIFYNESLEFKAILPRVSISDPLYINKIDDIILYNSENIQEYKTSCDYIKNIKQDNIPLKFVLNNDTEINQISFESSNNTYKVYYEDNKGANKYILEHNGKFFYIFPMQEGVIRHLPIFDKEVQIGEALGLTDTNKGNDEYRCFLKEEYCYLADGISCLLLFMDRNEYSSSYMTDGQVISTSSGDKNPYYDRGWLAENFKDEFNTKEDEDDDEYSEEATPNTIDNNINNSPKKLSSTNKILMIVGGVWIVLILLLIVAVLFFI